MIEHKTEEKHEAQEWCSWCVHFALENPSDNNNSSGRCHRYPPAVDRDGYGVWPKISHEGWCGEFQRDPRFVPPENGETAQIIEFLARPQLTSTHRPEGER